MATLDIKVANGIISSSGSGGFAAVQSYNDVKQSLFYVDLFLVNFLTLIYGEQSIYPLMLY